MLSRDGYEPTGEESVKFPLETRRASQGDARCLQDLFTRYRQRLRRMLKRRLDARVQGRVNPSAARDGTVQSWQGPLAEGRRVAPGRPLRRVSRS